MRKALYAFSGDPITYGHIDIVKRAANAFDEIIVGIGVNPEKNYMFTLEERTEMAKKVFKNIPNIKVIPFSGLVVDFAYENRIPVIIKGVRNLEDFDYENILHQCGESQKLGVDTFILTSKPELSHISSSAVKSIQKEQGLIHEYVPLHVKQMLEAKISGQYIVGITGEQGTGKSYISEKFIDIGKKSNIQVYNIELDFIGHDILSNLMEPKYQEVRQQIADTFGKEVLLQNGTIDRKILGDIVFHDYEKLKKLNDIMYTPLMVRLRRELYGKKGLIVFNAALIAETDVSYICNNNVILIKVDKETQNKRLKVRSLSQDQIKRRVASQYSFKQKKEFIENRIKENNHGKLWIFDNSDKSDHNNIQKLFNEIVKELSIK